MTIDDKIRDEKLQYDINREAAKISALSSGKIDKLNVLQVKKYYLLIKEKWQNKLNLLILLQENFFEKQTKTIEDQGEKRKKGT